MKKVFLIFAAGLMLTSCATVFTGRNKTVIIKSNQNADVYMNGHLVAKTNQYFDVSRANLVKYWEVKKEGCTTQGYEMPIKTNPVYYVNLPFVLTGFGLLGAVVDLGYDAHKTTLKEHTINIDCETK